MYSHDGVGLGHLRRNLRIASHIVETLPGASVLLIAGILGTPDFGTPPGVDIVKLPSVQKTAPGIWQPRSLNVDAPTITEMRSSAILALARTFTPSVFIADYLPSGVADELIPVLRLLKQRPNPCITILGLRDILDSRENTLNLWERLDYINCVNVWYNHVFVYGVPEIFGAIEHYGFDESLHGRAEYTGYIGPESYLRARPRLQMDNARRQGGKTSVLIVAGGGSDGLPMMLAASDALRRLCKKMPLSATFVCGPLMSKEDRNTLANNLDGPDFRSVDRSENLIAEMDASDLIISMGGYNAIVEAVALDKPTVIVPRVGGSQEQLLRSQEFSDKNLVTTVEMSDADPERFAAAIMKAVSSRSAQTQQPGFTGGTFVARRIAELTKDPASSKLSTSTAARTFQLAASPFADEAV